MQYIKCLRYWKLGKSIDGPARARQASLVSRLPLLRRIMGRERSPGPEASFFADGWAIPPTDAVLYRIFLSTGREGVRPPVASMAESASGLDTWGFAATSTGCFVRPVASVGSGGR